MPEAACALCACEESGEVEVQENGGEEFRSLEDCGDGGLGGHFG